MKSKDLCSLMVVAYIAIVLSFSACTTAQIGCFEPGKCENPTIIAPEVEAKKIEAVSISVIDDLAAKSKCAAIRWKDRGSVPVGYTKGMARVYARAVCSKRAVPKLGAHDSLAVYGLPANLDSTYVLLFGLGVRESSGQHCTGRDSSMDFKASTSAEAGLFQTSWGARFKKVVPPSEQLAMQKLFDGYKKDPSRCQLAVFSKGVKCSSGDAKTWGEGEGATWQKLTKACPAFAAEYAEYVLRYNAMEFGPIKHKKVEVRTECADMFSQVRKLVDANPGLCSSL